VRIFQCPDFISESLFSRFCNEYEGNEMEETISPRLGIGAKPHYCIFHDECCFHANDQSGYVWMREGEQPLQGKSRGRLVHVSDFIIEDTPSGRLTLTPDQILAQMELPLAPQKESPAQQTPQPEPSSSDTPVPPQKGKVKRAPKPKNKRGAPATGRTEAEHSWTPPPAPRGTTYRLSSFDARRIIYPGANYDAWWDMPQLIAQVFMV
jgi:hypothetical protein